MGRKESAVENYLRERVVKLGGVYRKVTYQGRKGALDLWCFFPGGRLLIVETKRPGKNSLDPLQEVELDFLKRFQFHADWANSKEEIDAILEAFCKATGYQVA